MQTPDSAQRRTSDHLANERTFLSWIRTSIAMIGLGFVVARFSVWLHQLSAQLNEPARAHHIGLSLPLGLAMMACGGSLAVIAAVRYRNVRKAIERNETAADAYGHAIVTTMVLVITTVLIAYMIATK